MKKVKLQDNFYIKIFKSENHNCTIVAHLDKDNNVSCLNYQQGTDELDPKTLEFDPANIPTVVYDIYKKINGGHSVKLYDFAIVADVINKSKDVKIGELELENDALKNELKELKAKIAKLSDF